MPSRSQNVPGTEGIDYEVNLLTLFSLKALFSVEIADFQIESNNDRYGKFDDIILTSTLIEGEEIKIAFQLKHKKNAKALKREQLENEKGDFSIHKYFKSYRDKIKPEEKQNCHYVLFTNNQIDINVFNSEDSKYSIVQDTSNIFFDIFNSGEVHKFRSNKNDVSQNEFFDRFYLFSSQNNEKEVENEIDGVFAQHFGSNEFANTASVLKLFRDLHKKRFTNKILDKATLICHLINSVILRHHSINLEQVQTSQESFCKYFYDAVKLFDATHISCENLDFLKRNLIQFNDVSEENPFRWAQDHKFVDREMRDADFHINSHCRILYHIDNQPIVLNYTRNSAKAINCVMKLCNKKFPQIKFIIVGSETDFMNLYKKDPDLNLLNIFKNLSSLQMKDETVYKQLIDKFEFEVEGSKLTGLTEYILSCNQISDNITPYNIIMWLRKGKIELNEVPHPDAENFVAEYLAGNYEHISRSIEWQTFLFDDKNEKFKHMFDIKMAEGCPAHIAVLCKNKEKLALCNEEDTAKYDKLNRNIWHLICTYGDKFPCPVASFYEKVYYRIEETVEKFQPQNKHEHLYKYIKISDIAVLKKEDDLSKKSSLAYLKKNFTLNIIDYIVSEIDSNDIHNLLASYNNSRLILYYSLKFGYLTLLHLDLIKNKTIKSLFYVDSDNYKKQNALYIVAKFGQLEVLRYLYYTLKMNPEYQIIQDAICVAAGKGHQHIVKELDKHCHDIGVASETPLFASVFEADNVNIRDKYGKTPLFWAAYQGHLDLVKELIAHNQDVNVTDENGRTPFWWAAFQGHLEILKEFISHNANVNATDKDGRSSLWWATKRSNLDIVKELIEHSADVNTTDKDGETPLFWAAYKGYLDVVKELIKHNADVNATDKDGWTALRVAAEKDHVDIVKELIAHNANINAPDKYGGTPLMAAALEGNINTIKELIAHENVKTNINAGDEDGRTPLWAAVFNNHLDTVKELIAHTADVNVADKTGSTPLGLVAEKGNLDILKELIEHNADVNATDMFGRTPLFRAAEKGQLNIVKELIARNADVNATDKYKTTPFKVALQKGHADIVQVLNQK